MVSETGADGIRKTYQYDALNRLISQQEQNLTTGETRYTETDYSYGDVSVNEGKAEQKTWTKAFITTQTVKESSADLEGNVTSVSYQNGLNQVVRQITYGVTTDYSYDANGNRITEYMVTDSELNEGRVVYHVYDKEGRETSTVYNPVYNAEKTRFEVGEETIYELVSYDEAGNVSQTVDGEGNVTRYTYDNAGRIIKVTLI